MDMNICNFRFQKFDYSFEAKEISLVFSLLFFSFALWNRNTVCTNE